MIVLINFLAQQSVHQSCVTYPVYYQAMSTSKEDINLDLGVVNNLLTKDVHTHWEGRRTTLYLE